MRRPASTAAAASAAVPASAATRVTASMSGKPNTFRARERPRRRPATPQRSVPPIRSGARRPPARRCRRCRGSRSCRRGTRRRRPRSPRCRQLGRCRRPPDLAGQADGREGLVVEREKSQDRARVQSHGTSMSGSFTSQDRPRAIGTSIRGGPICAMVEPSWNSTIEWIICCGCTTTSMDSKGMSKSRWPRSPRAPCSPALRSCRDHPPHRVVRVRQGLVRVTDQQLLARAPSEGPRWP